MTSFTGGPADGVVLTLGRSPILLRVVQSPNGKFDALDQLDDEPKRSETIWVYQRVGGVGTAFVDYHGRDGRRRGCRAAIANYLFVKEQPVDGQIRDTAAWRTWCQSHTAMSTESSQENKQCHS